MLTTGGLRPVMRGWAKSAGIGRLSPHDLRRTFATVAIRLGAPSRIVQVAGRWSRLEMVERYTRTIEAADMDPWFPVNRAMGET
jgi:integrase